MRKSGLAEMLRIIREEDAPALSRKLSAMGAAAVVVAANRQTDPASLRRLVDGDLNSITTKALEKVRGRRYASVAELAADIQRHIEDRPVLAAPPGKLYRAGKFLRRHRVAFVGAISGLAFILLSGVTVWLLLHRAAPPRPGLTEKKTIVLGRFRKRHWRSRLRCKAGPSPGSALGEFTWSGPTFRRAREPNAPFHGPASRAKLTPPVAAEICERTASAAVVEGSISSPRK